MREPRIADLGAATAIEIIAANILPEVRRAMVMARRRFEAMTQQEIARLIGESFSTSRTLNRLDEEAGRHTSALARMAAMTALMEVAKANAEMLDERLPTSGPVALKGVTP